jgi:PAS domain-containing protein
MPGSLLTNRLDATIMANQTHGKQTMKKADAVTNTSEDLLAIYQALDRVQAIIEFDLMGKVVSANDNFLQIFGY